MSEFAYPVTLPERCTRVPRGVPAIGILHREVGPGRQEAF